MAFTNHTEVSLTTEVSTSQFEKDLETLLMIRHFEYLLLSLFQQGKLNGTTHTCLGQEYIPVAVAHLLHQSDFIFSNHRGHGHYLARFQDPAGLLAEITGKDGAICNGVGGSQHIKRGRYLSTGVQGESLPVAVGVAIQLKREKQGGIAVVFIGDGTWGQGAVYEALNMASLWAVPLVVIVENNHIAQSTPRTLSMAGTIKDRVAAFGIDYCLIEGNEIATIRATIAPLLDRVRAASGRPLVIEFDTHRLGSHSKGDDTRSLDAIALMKTRDWHSRYQLSHGKLLGALEENVQVQLTKLQKEVEGRKFSSWISRYE
jgi:TPP-dependent pyruvate/acetoin dehydrogenase alpha subunit